MSATIVGIVVIEQAFPESTLPRQGVVDGALAGIAVEFAPLAAFQEKKVNLSVVVARRALWQMEHQPRERCQHPNPDAPRPVAERHRLRHHTQADGQIDAEEPHVAREAVEHPSHDGFLPREPSHLAVGGVAEVGQHQQRHANEVVRQVGEIEIPSRRQPQEYRQDGNSVGMHTQANPKQGKNKANGTGEVDIEPLLGIVRLECRTQHLIETFAVHRVVGVRRREFGSLTSS